MILQESAVAALDPAELEDVSTRALHRQLRRPASVGAEGEPQMPESALWQAWVELRRRGEADVDEQFLRSLRSLHRRRGVGGSSLPTEDPDPWEHRLSEDPLLSELWRAYKRCLAGSRLGPASQLLRDIERQVSAEDA